MVDVLSVVLAVAATIAAGSLASIAVVVYRRSSVDDPPGLWEARVREYGEMMRYVIEINKLAVELQEEDRFIFEQEKYVMDDESKFESPVEELIRIEQRSSFVVGAEVSSAVSEYVDYLSSYHKEPQVEELLYLGGQIVQSMRRELNLASLRTAGDGDENAEEVIEEMERQLGRGDTAGP
jgi:hypothetical protein